MVSSIVSLELERDSELSLATFRLLFSSFLGSLPFSSLDGGGGREGGWKKGEEEMKRRRKGEGGRG